MTAGVQAGATMSPGRPSGEDGRGQSNVLGYLLLIAIIVAGTSLVVVFGADALQQTNSQSELKRAEQTMTLFDSRAAMVALGTSENDTTGAGARPRRAGSKGVASARGGGEAGRGPPDPWGGPPRPLSRG